ncbi:WD repeat-containing protein 82 [Astathelohania contejeani]|uniref:WD repeat-containing protein 82 n=1 Tax=Astathelohania contejeani TaxID=164912 RepID=A0ABQ7HWH2_9MICR|nr:WD repeat-containing protein 82 [Thelohania contejeani]
MILTDNSFKNFNPSKVQKEKSVINCVRFSDDGSLLGTTTATTLKIFDPLTSKLQTCINIHSTKLFDFFFPNTIIHTADHNLKYLSIFDNHYIRNFKNHRSTIRSLSVSKRTNIILSTSKERVNIWDISVRNPIYTINCVNSVGCLSNLSTDFCVSVNNAMIKFFDLKQATFGPYYTIPLLSEIVSMEYTFDDRFVVVTTTTAYVFISTDKHEIYWTISMENRGRGCVTPDSRYFLCTSGAYIFVYDIIARKKLHSYKDHINEYGNIRFNPLYAQFVTGGSAVRYWLPKSDK